MRMTTRRKGNGRDARASTHHGLGPAPHRGVVVALAAAGELLEEMAAEDVRAQRRRGRQPRAALRPRAGRLGRALHRQVEVEVDNLRRARRRAAREKARVRRTRCQCRPGRTSSLSQAEPRSVRRSRRVSCRLLSSRRTRSCEAGPATQAAKTVARSVGVTSHAAGCEPASATLSAAASRRPRQPRARSLASRRRGDSAA